MSADFVPDDTGLRAPLGVTPTTPDPSGFLGAAFRQANTVVSVVQAIRNSGPFTPEPGYSAWSDIKGTPYVDYHADRFAGSSSPAETQSIKRQIDQEEADQRTLRAAGAMGTIASMVAGTVDPTMLIPMGGELLAGGKAAGALRTAARVGAEMAAQSTVQEAALQGSQETRTASESALNIGSATLLSALLGAGASSLLAREGRLAPTVAALDSERAEMAAHARAEPSGIPGAAANENAPASPAGPPLDHVKHAEWRDGQSGVPAAAAAGAAASDTRKLDLVSSGLDKIPGVGTLLQNVDPMSRLLTSDSVSARRAAADLAETPLRFEQNLQGIPTTAGPALDRIARLQINQTRVAVADELDRQWKDLRFAGADVPWFAKLRDQAGALNRPAELPNFDQFKAMVSDAMRSGDRHDIPQVQAAAQFVRARVFDPWKQRAIEAGLLPEGVDVKTADSYLQRVYSKQVIAARRPEFVNTVQAWLKSDQATKAASQDRLRLYSGAMRSHEETIAKIEAKLQGRTDALDMVEGRAEELTRLNKAAFQRAKQLRESQYENVGGIREDRPGKNIDNARGGAVFETKIRNRGNTLADQASGKSAEIAELERKLTEEIAASEQMREKIEAEIAAWEGKSAGDAKAAIAGREKYRTEAVAAGKAPEGRLAGADTAVDRAVRRIIESDRNVSDAELRGRAHEIAERILGSPSGRLPYEAASGGPEIGYHAQAPEPPRGPLAHREFAIPDAAIRDYLEHDIEHIIGTHLRTMVPDVLLTERFGDTRMTEAFRKIEDDYAALIDATKSEATRTKLGKQREADLRDLAAVRDRIRGVYGLDTFNAMRGAARTGQAVKNLNVLTSMGMAAISSLPDMAGSVFRFGLGTTFRESWLPFLRFMMRQDDTWKEAARQFRAMGIAVESFTADRQHALADVMDGYKPQSRLERTLQWGAEKFQFLNALGFWTDFGKVNASMVAGSEILRAAELAAKGAASKKQIASLAESGIDLHMADRIAKQFAAGGETRDAVRLPNTDQWTDQTARAAFEGAVSREADIAIITPGQEKPLWLSNPVVSVLGQFKSFTAASTQRMLVANLQRHDAQVLQGLLFSLGLGMLSYKVNALLGGQPTSDKPQDWIKEAMSRGNLFGWFEEGNALASKMTRGGVDMYRLIGAGRPLSRYAGRSVLDQILGPTAGKIGAISQVTGAAGQMEWKASDTTALRKLIAFQNLFYLRGLFNQVEAGADAAFGIPVPTKH